MNIKELKELIANLPDEMDVILSSDSEGNKYSEAYDHGIIDANNESLQALDSGITSPLCLVLYPMH